MRSRIGLDGHSPGERRASNGVELPRLKRSDSPGETVDAAGKLAAAQSVRNRTSEGSVTVCGELTKNGERCGFKRS